LKLFPPSDCSSRRVVNDDVADDDDDDDDDEMELTFSSFFIDVVVPHFLALPILLVPRCLVIVGPVVASTVTVSMVVAWGDARLALVMMAVDRSALAVEDDTSSSSSCDGDDDG